MVWRKVRIAVFDPQPIGHALKEQRIALIVLEHRPCEAATGVMNVVGRHRCRDAINVCCSQTTEIAEVWLFRSHLVLRRVAARHDSQRQPSDGE